MSFLWICVSLTYNIPRPVLQHLSRCKHALSNRGILHNSVKINIFASWVDVVFNKRNFEIPSLITFCMFKKLCISYETMEMCAPVNASYSVTSIYQKNHLIFCLWHAIYAWKTKSLILSLTSKWWSFCKRSKIQKYNLAEPTSALGCCKLTTVRTVVWSNSFDPRPI